VVEYVGGSQSKRYSGVSWRYSIKGSSATKVRWPPFSTPREGFLGQLADVILGGSPFKLT